jgi:hypothetical protein
MSNATIEALRRDLAALSERVEVLESTAIEHSTEGTTATHDSGVTLRVTGPYLAQRDVYDEVRRRVRTSKRGTK